MDINDKTKTFLYMEDNGDGTCTGTLSIPEIDLFETQILTMDFAEYIATLMAQVPVELVEELNSKSISVPESPEE